ncbi:hypothetical protein V1478_006728 [Vespula squamosa]|uniref:Uncharacterized protein n=1 Tax=Vespula squamosa TaxID=30214 RepID=A0ABD2B126_VESSQ
MVENENIEKMSDITFYLRSLFVTTTRDDILWELRCTLFGSQIRTELVIVKVDQMSDFVDVIIGNVPRNQNF